jgi:hypothetical protein
VTVPAQKNMSQIHTQDAPAQFCYVSQIRKEMTAGGDTIPIPLATSAVAMILSAQLM